MAEKLSIIFVLLFFILYFIDKIQSKRKDRINQIDFSEQSIDLTEPETNNILAIKPVINESLRKFEIPIEGLQEEEKEVIRNIIVTGFMEGESSYTIDNKLREILGNNDFEWPDFDEWCKIFKKSGYWPYMWRDIPKYIYFQEAPLEELLKEFTKKRLRSIGEKHSIPININNKKAKIIESLKNCRISRNKLLEEINEIWFPRYIRQKRELLGHTLLFQLITDKQIEDLARDGFMIRPGLLIDECPFCNNKKNKRLPPFHPGCRCYVEAVLDD